MARWRKATIEPTGEPVDAPALFDLLEEALARVVAWRRVDRDERVLRFHAPLSFAGWGEEVEVEVAGASVETRSRCRMRFQIVDWGKNLRNVETVRAAIARVAPRLREG